MNKKNRKGFTLAEVLVTLVVLGIVAAIVIPTVIQNTQQAEYKSALKENNAVLSGALLRLTTNNSGSLAGTFTGATDFKNKLSAYLNVAKDCNGSGLGSCWASSTSYMNHAGYISTDQSFNAWNEPTILLSNGVSVHFDYGNGQPSWGSTSCNTTWGGNFIPGNACISLDVDINGLKGPNIVGVDTFIFIVSNTGVLIPFGSSSTTGAWNPATDCTPTGTGYGCAAYYLMGN